MKKLLQQLEKKSPLRVETKNGMENAMFDHLDGAYSYCYLTRDKSKVFHLSVMTPMVLVDGRWEIDPEPKSGRDELI